VAIFVVLAKPILREAGAMRCLNKFLVGVFVSLAATVIVHADDGCEQNCAGIHHACLEEAGNDEAKVAICEKEYVECLKECKSAKHKASSGPTTAHESQKATFLKCSTASDAKKPKCEPFDLITALKEARAKKQMLPSCKDVGERCSSDSDCCSNDCGYSDACGGKCCYP
jgi:hypothetical protein